MVFNDCQGQWRRDSNGTPEAIDRVALQHTLTLWPVPVELQSDCFHRVRVLEAIVAQELRLRAKSN